MSDLWVWLLVAVLIAYHTIGVLVFFSKRCTEARIRLKKLGYSEFWTEFGQTWGWPAWIGTVIKSRKE